MIQAWEKWSPISRENVARVTRRGPAWINPAKGHEMWTAKQRYGHIEAGSDEAAAMVATAKDRDAQAEAAEAAIDAATGRLEWEDFR
jgi:hypothetical protein